MPITFALLAGALATLNPCGFAVLPAFLSYYVGTDDDHLPGASSRGLQGILVGLTVSAGFLAVFSVLGIPVVLGIGQVSNAVPWIGFALGLVMVGAAIATLMGKSIGVRAQGPRIARNDRGVRTMFLFGLGYGLASLGCTMPIFLVLVGASLATGGGMAAVVVFGFYAIGMAVVLMALSISTALLRGGITRLLRRALPHMRWFSGGLLLLAALYLTYYWGSVLYRSADARAGDPVIAFVEGSVARLQAMTDSGGGRWLMLASLLVVAAAVLIWLVKWAGRPHAPTDPLAEPERRGQAT
ncbi:MULTISPECIES: cytochrome c biogenesis CcdA family protein [Saccharothrix]|uniref:cytochrome c biogenesis CcdA family protein n=1 Tax=Saccharothrix TaxID=2071 RepID=UPI0009402875|nr:cytochrome c biogenesis protein CcdA [Saccharothrix sp. CB00851]OKI13778.1 hypothetical protein A6A25_15940 [Saccharothrix sp. CB00851]